MHLSILDNMRLIFFHFALVRAALPYCPFRRREVCCPDFRYYEIEKKIRNKAKAVNGKEVLQYSGGDVEVMAGLKADLDRYPRNIRYLWVPVSYRLWHRMLEQR